MKRIVSMMLCLLMTFAALSYVAPTASATDPADSYVVQRAPYEDSAIRMWFNHPNVKVRQEDHTSTGKNTYSAYMAKNEYQGMQVTLYSPSVTKSNLTASVTSFTAMNGSGAEMTAELFYEYYIKCEGLDTTDVLGVTNSNNSIIKEGMIPDAMVEIADINTRTGKFTLAAGKSQTLYIKIKSELTTPSGWYSAQFDLKNSSGNVVKTATVYAYVWNFAIPEATHLQTGIYLDKKSLSDAQYRIYYEYLLDNRICAFDPPGELNSSNPYISNPRVNAFRVTHYSVGSYLGTQYNTNELRALYDDLSSMPNGDEIKDKVYFYVADEPRGEQQKNYIVQYYQSIGNTSYVFPQPTLPEIFPKAAAIRNAWPGAYTLVTIDDNQPYPYPYNVNAAYNSATGTYLTEDDHSGRFDSYGDAIQGIINNGSVTLFCMKTQAFTPRSVLRSLGFEGTYRTYKVMHLNGKQSGFDCGNPAAAYFDWDSKYGEFKDRFASYKATSAAQDKDVKLWVYMCGKGPDYTYCNHLIENTGLQSELLFWQTMQNGATGYLYYAANFWTSTSTDEEPYLPYAEGSSLNCDGTTVQNKWCVDKRRSPYAPDPVNNYDYGNGMIFYGESIRTYLKTRKLNRPVQTVRVEHMRDGIEDYEMLYMYRDAYGQAAMDQVISQVSTNVVNYLSLPGFNRSGWSNSMTSEDIFAEVRKNLGNAVEAASPHTHTPGEPVVTVAPTCTESGEQTISCVECGELISTETIAPLGHTPDTDWTVTVQSTCTETGLRAKFCTVCGAAVETEEIPATGHTLGPWVTVTHATCTESGLKQRSCTVCGAVLQSEPIASTGHTWDDGVVTTDPTYT
ncbi:MAG: DUF4091 domain-containing protein, partial [Clostridia bacterium]|nr:DUF4091 domain-containing protein [Clostridia bacterium]